MKFSWLSLKSKNKDIQTHIISLPNFFSFKSCLDGLYN